LSFDLAALLCPITNEKNLLNKNNDIKILGVSILPYFEIYLNDEEKDIRFVYEISKGINNWLKEDPRSIIYLFNFKGKSRDHDVDITGMLQTKIHHNDRVKIMPYNPDPMTTLRLVSQCHAFLGMRYHSCVFAYLTNTPLLIINYFQKCQSLAEDVGLSENAVISPEEILDGKFWMFLKRLQDRPEDFIARLPIDSAKELARNNFKLDQFGGF
jgi:polysaccharide pyruvyl transferase WcaK-like protein